MSISWLECARRRRALLGRSPALQHHVRFTKPVAAATSGILEAADEDGSRGRAMAARHRLDEKLRATAPSGASRGSKASSSSASSLDSSVPASVPNRLSSFPSGGSQQPHATASGTAAASLLKGRKGSEERCRGFGLREERVKLNVGGKVQGECPVCLDSFVSGQMVMYLPCHHRFHSTCLVPWRLNHCHCPFCRADLAFECNPDDPLT
eukprot:c18676_g1_i3 orf=337-963(+)